MYFSEINIHDEIKKSLVELNFITTTEIQTEAIPFLLENKTDLIALAQTGTGKTAAFGIPIINKIIIKNNFTQCIVLCPTRELCIQITKDLDEFSKYINIKINAVYGGTDIKSQIKSLSKGNHIIVGTPGRVIDLIKRKKINLEKINTVVMDEADEMLNMGFKKDIDTILQKTPSNKQTLLFSATMPKDVLKISKNYMEKPHTIEVSKRNEGAKNITHTYYIVGAREKYSALKRLCDYHPNIYGIVFCRTRRECKEVSNKLMKDGYNADALHGDLSQSQRDHVMGKFRQRNLEILVATDVAARGLDVNDITHIINYNLPDDNEVYIHRSGRTARANKKGSSIIIATDRNLKKIQAIEKMINKKINFNKMPTGDMICENQLLNLITKVINSKVDNQIDKYLPGIIEKLSHLDKETLIKHFVSVEFNRFLSFYKKSPDLKKKDKHDFEKSTDKQLVRFHMNVGKKNGVGAQHILGLINDKIQKRNIFIGKIDIMKSFSFFEIEQEQEISIIKKLNNIKWRGAQLKVEKAKEFTKEKVLKSKKKRKKSRKQ
ncbi:MAG: DEAD/DEAH box helicase [Flavobacteriales bacterium]|nr:DEAD/DEAH box helicase [Flavobacteriales bacterium]|tara:strand:- start:2679 stop:4322 length:1644 start_codon:yes stop_codon:yes gene_type:complete